MEMERFHLLDIGPQIGVLNGAPIHEWVHLSDGRVMIYEGVVRSGEPFELHADMVVLNDALLYREDPGRRGMSAEQMRDWVRRGDSLTSKSAALVVAARVRYAASHDWEIPDGGAVYPGVDGGAWISARVRVETSPGSSARAAAIEQYDRVGEVEVQPEEPEEMRPDGTVWVSALVFLPDDVIGALH